MSNIKNQDPVDANTKLYREETANAKEDNRNERKYERQLEYSKLLSLMRLNWMKLRSKLCDYQDNPFQAFESSPLCLIHLPDYINFDGIDKDELLVLPGHVNEENSDRYHIAVKIHDENEDESERHTHTSDFRFLISIYLAKLKTLFSFVIKHDIKVNFIGKIDPDHHTFTISDIFFDNSNSSYYSPSQPTAEDDEQQPLLHLTIQYILGRKDIEKDFYAREYTSQIEYQIIANFLIKLYPESIQKAINRNLAILVSYSANKDDRKHASTTLNFLVNVNWNSSQISLPPISEIRKQLDEKFYGLEQVKIQILELAAIMSAGGSIPPWGILLVGPAGTGKTAVSHFLAKLFNRPVSRIDMNAITDREDLTGSSRIYGNGIYGKFAQTIFNERTTSQILIINELDKCDDGAKGSCSDVVLSFVDHYGFIDTYIQDPIPTENIFCIGTANSTDGICEALLDRFYRIDIPAYSMEEKRNILKNYTIPQMLSEQNLTADNLVIEDDAIDCLCFEYGRTEAGVRPFQRYMSRIIGNYFLTCAETGDTFRRYTSEDIQTILGPSHIRKRTRLSSPGMALTAYTYNGVTYPLVVEASACVGNGGFDVIGSSGDAMLAHCKTAYMCLKTCSGINLDALDVTVVLSGTVPDTPENIVGLAAFAAIYTACTNSSVFQSAAFVGGCDLHGNTYFDGLSLDPYLQEFAENDIETIYVPYGSSKLIYRKNHKNIKILETINMQALISVLSP